MGIPVQKKLLVTLTLVPTHVNVHQSQFTSGKTYFFIIWISNDTQKSSMNVVNKQLKQKANYPAEKAEEPATALTLKRSIEDTDAVDGETAEFTAEFSTKPDSVQWSDFRF